MTGLDISDPMLQVAASMSSPVRSRLQWQEGSAENLPFDTKRFYVDLCQQEVQFVPDRKTAGCVMHRVLKHAGTAGVSVWRRVEHQPPLAALIDAMDRQYGATVNDPFSLGDAIELRAIFDDARFQDIAVEVVRRRVIFPSAEQFIRLTVLSASAVIPELAAASESEQDAAIDSIRQDISDQIREGKALRFQ